MVIAIRNFTNFIFKMYMLSYVLFFNSYLQLIQAMKTTYLIYSQPTSIVAAPEQERMNGSFTHSLIDC